MSKEKKHCVSTWLVTIFACVELVLSLGFAGIRQFAREKFSATRSHEFISGCFHFVCAQGHSKCDWFPVFVAHRISRFARGRIIVSERAERNSEGKQSRERVVHVRGVRPWRGRRLVAPAGALSAQGPPTEHAHASVFRTYKTRPVGRPARHLRQSAIHSGGGPLGSVSVSGKTNL